MVRFLLFIFLVQYTIGSYKELIVDKDYNGTDRYLLLDPDGYFDPANTTKRTPLNGNPHYMWGIRKEGDSKAYFSRVTNRWLFEENWEQLYISTEDLKGGIITSIQVLDRKWDKNEKNVKITEGRVGGHFLYLSFQFKWYQSIDYLISVFVKKQ